MENCIFNPKYQLSISIKHHMTCTAVKKIYQQKNKIY